MQLFAEMIYGENMEIHLYRLGVTPGEICVCRCICSSHINMFKFQTLKL